MQNDVGQQFDNLQSEVNVGQLVWQGAVLCGWWNTMMWIFDKKFIRTCVMDNVIKQGGCQWSGRQRIAH